MGRRRLHRPGPAADGRDRGELRRVPGGCADRTARRRDGLLAGRVAPPAAARRRGWRTPPRVHDPRGGRTPPRRHRRAPATDVVRRPPLAGRAAHAGRVVRARRRRHRRRVGARRRRRRTRRGSSAARRPAMWSGMRCSRRAGSSRRLPSPRPPGFCSTPRCARPLCTWAASGSPPWMPQPAARSPSSSSAGPAVRSDAQQLAGGNGTSAFLLLVPALIVFAVAVAVGAAARAHAPRARSCRPPRSDLPAARRGVAGAQSRPRGDRGDLPRREPRPRPVRGRLPLDAAARPARRGVVRRAGRRTSSPRISHSSFPCCTARRHGRCPARRLRCCASPATSRRARRSASWPCRDARCPHCRGGARTSRTSPSRHSATGSRRVRAGLQLLTLPAGRQFTLPVTATGDDIGIRAFFRSRLGDYVAVSLGHTSANHRVVLHGRIPFRHATLAELELDILNSGRLTANAGTGIQPSAKGALVFGVPRVNGGGGARRIRTLGGHRRRRWNCGQGRLPAHAGPHRHLPPETADRRPAAARARDAEDRRRWRGLAGSSRSTSRASRLPAASSASSSVFRRSSVTPWWPTSSRQARDWTLSPPGLGTTNELWLRSATPPHVPEVSVQSHAETLARLQADPLARGALLTLAGTAAVALLLALLGLVLSVVSDVRDDRGELFDLEAQGAAPATIRAHLRLRALLVAAFGIVGGLAARCDPRRARDRARLRDGERRRTGASPPALARTCRCSPSRRSSMSPSQCCSWARRRACAAAPRSVRPRWRHDNCN